MHKTKTTQTKRNHHNTRCTWFTPSVVATSTELCFIQLFTNNSFDLRTQLQISADSAIGLLNNPKTAHLAVDIFLLTAHSAADPFLQNPLRTQLQRSSMHTVGT